MKPTQIEWKPVFNIGVEDIDFQHHYFLNLINRLSHELSEADNPDYRLSLVKELNAYAKFHFLSEENMMWQAGYPDLEAHRRLHLQLIDQLSHRQASLILKPSKRSARAILEFLAEWFLKHTQHEDQLFGGYMAEKASLAELAPDHQGLS